MIVLAMYDDSNNPKSPDKNRFLDLASIMLDSEGQKVHYTV